LEEEIQQIVDDMEEEDIIIHQDLLPDNSIIKLMGITWEGMELWRKYTPESNCYLASPTFPQKGDAFSIVLLQTSRPKATELIKQIKELGNIQGVCFSPAERLGDRLELGLLVMGNEELHLFGEFTPAEQGMRKRWLKRCENTKGICAVVIAMGLSGATRGKPNLSHILAYYEVPLIDSEDLGLELLKSSLIDDSEDDSEF
jgi:hypothetical protein